MLSGQYLHADEDSQLAIRIDVETVGVAEDSAVLSTEVRVSIFLCNLYTFLRTPLLKLVKLSMEGGGTLYKVTSIKV